MTRTRAAVVTGLAAVLLASGCSPDAPESPDAAPSDESSASAAASPSPEPSATNVVVAPERPSDMDDDGPAGAEAAATYFLQLDDYIMKTGDTAEWEAMSHKECGYCTNRLEQAQLIAERDDSFEGGNAQIRIVHTYSQDAATGIWPVDVEITESRSTITDAQGEVVFEQKADTSTARVEAAMKDGQWVIITVGDIPES